MGAVDRADALAERYVDLLDADDTRATEVRIFQADVLEGQPVIQLDRLARTTAYEDSDQERRVLERVRGLAEGLSYEDLRIVAQRVPRGAGAAPLLALLSAELLARGEDQEARSTATDALRVSTDPRDRAIARGVLDGELPDGLRPVRAFTIAAVLPLGGPPAIADYASSVLEGIEVAVATVLGDEYDVAFETFDSEADPDTVVALVARLEESEVVGAVGFLLDDELLAAGLARTRGLPLVSPSARNSGGVGSGAYSLEGPDPGAAQSVALYAARRAHQRVAMIYPDTPDAAAEGDAFAEVAEALGIPVVGRFPYPAGATDFEAQFRQAQQVLRAEEVAALGLTEADSLVRVAELVEPVGLFMPIPSEDVEFVAPQFAHHGLDTLAIEVLGTTGWSDPQVVAEIDPYLLEGIVATSPVGGGIASPGYEAFRLAYEEHFTRSLVSATPAIGYDATLLLLEALRPGRVGPDDVWAAFEDIEEIEGATGIFTVRDGRIARRTEVVRIEDGALVQMPAWPYGTDGGR